MNKRNLVSLVATNFASYFIGLVVVRINRIFFKIFRNPNEVEEESLRIARQGSMRERPNPLDRTTTCDDRGGNANTVVISHLIKEFICNCCKNKNHYGTKRRKVKVPHVRIINGKEYTFYTYIEF